MVSWRQQLSALTLGACLCFSNTLYAGVLEDGIAAYQTGDPKRAFGLLQPLARQGNAEAQNYLGLLYANGKGVQRDDTTAAYWFRQAADQDNDKAKRNLAYLIANGRAKAKVWDDYPDCR